ncbi:MAG: hypothetical protein AAFX99_32885 [Myxococcota bacterium]
MPQQHATPSKTHGHTSGLPPGFLLALLAIAPPTTLACGDNTDARLGNEGEVCLTDLDCSDGLLCSGQQCALPNGSGNNQTSANNSTGQTSGGHEDLTGEDDVDVMYGFVLIEDLGPSDPGGDAPGADIDAVSVTVDGFESFANSIEDFSLGRTNFDFTQALGAPDSGCAADNFVSLGGQGGYLIVSFGAVFGAGERITVYELGPTMCPNQPGWVDDAYAVSISASFGPEFVEIGTGGPGINTFRVP